MLWNNRVLLEEADHIPNSYINHYNCKLPLWFVQVGELSSACLVSLQNVAWQTHSNMKNIIIEQAQFSMKVKNIRNE